MGMVFERQKEVMVFFSLAVVCVVQAEE